VLFTVVQSIDVPMSEDGLKYIAESLSSADSTCILHKYAIHDIFTSLYFENETLQTANAI